MNSLGSMMDNPGSAFEQSTMIGGTTVIGGVSQVNPDLENNSQNNGFIFNSTSVNNSSVFQF